MPELSFLLSVLREILALVVSVFLLRFILQAVRADFRNPIAQFIVRFTNPIVLPLRKVLPPIGRTDTASVAAVLLVQFVVTAAVNLLMTRSLAIAPGTLVADSIIQLLSTTLNLYMGAIFVYVLMSWINTGGGYNPVAQLLARLCEPVLGPVRRTIPALGGLDLSPMIVLLALELAQIVLAVRIAPLLRDLLG